MKPFLAQAVHPEYSQATLTPGSSELVITRLIRASRARVWAAWGDPAQLACWWGPRGFSITTHTFALRPGGSWQLTMHGPDPSPNTTPTDPSRDFANHIVWDALEASQRIVYHHESADGQAPMHFTTIVTFEEVADNAEHTRITWRSDFGSSAARDHVAQHYGAVQGGQETLARLAAHVEGTGLDDCNAASGFPLTLIRDLPAASAQLWRCWTEPELIKEWFCPKPWQVIEVDNDLRPGGRSNNVMQGPGPDGQIMRNANTGSYLEIIPGKKIVFTDLLLEDWAPNPHKFIGFTAAITLEDMGPGRCRYTAICKHSDAASQQQHAQMGFHEGWGIATDQLLALATTL